MMVRIKKLAIIAAVAALAVLVPLIVFHARSPVLVLTDSLFIWLYGEETIRRQALFSSFALFRPVKPVAVANDAGDDIIQIAISDVSSKPFCVIFPVRFARAAAIYRENNQDTRVVVLEGMSSIKGNPSAGYFIYKTDIDDAFYRAGIAAAALYNNGKTALFLEPHIQTQATEAFIRAFTEQNKRLEPRVFSYFPEDFPDISDFSCVVLAGAGAEYLDGKRKIPVIFFSWLNPDMIPDDVVLVIDDSPWAQTVQAVTLAAAGVKSGEIRSIFLVLDRKRFDRGLLRKIEK